MGFKSQVLIAKKFNGTRRIIGKRNVKLQDGSFTWKKKPYIIDMALPSYRHRPHWYSMDEVTFYQYDIDNGQVIEVDKELSIQTGFMDIVLKGKLIPQLVEHMGKAGIFDAAIIGYIIMAAFGVFIGLFIGQFIEIPGTGSP